MRYTFFLIYMSLSVFAISQQKQIDSLQNLIHATNVDTLKVNLLNQLALLTHKTDSANTFKNAKLAYELANKKNYYFGKIESLLARSGFYIFKYRGNEAMLLLNEAIELANKLKNNNVKAKILLELSQSKYTLVKHKEAIIDLQNAEQIYLANKNDKELEKVYELLGSNYSELGNYETSLTYLFKSLAIQEKLNLKKNIASTFNNIGRQLYNMKNFEEAIVYYDKSIKASKETGDARTYGITLVNTANILISQEKYIEGEKRLLQAIEAFTKIGFKRGIQTCYNNLGAINLRASEFSKGIEYLKNAYQIANENKTKQGTPLIQHNIGFGYRGLGNYNEAIKWYELAEKTATEIYSDPYTFTEIYKYRALLDSAMGNYKSAYVYKNKYQILYEKILNDKVISSTNELKTKYETNQKENKIIQLNQADSIKNLRLVAQQVAINKNLFEISQQQLTLAEDSILLFSQNQIILQNKLDSSVKEEKINVLTKESLQKQLALQQQEADAKQKKQLLYFLLGGTLIAASLLFLAFYQRNKKMLAEEKSIAQKALIQSILETEEKERSRIAKDLHDGIVQDLTAIKMNINAVAKNVPATMQQQLNSVFNDIDIAAKEVREISYQMMPVTLKELGLQKALQELCNRSLTKNNLTYDFDCIGIEERLSEKIEVTVYRICQELINNTIKHSGASQISLLLQLRNKTLQLTYEDNGKGFDAHTTNKGIGLNSLDSRLEMVNGNIEFDDTIQTGTTAYIKIPIV